MIKINSNQGLAEKDPRKPRILVVPLDWGLGHASRCIPVIYELLLQKADVWLAAEGSQEALLKTEFPQLPLLPLSGYRVTYGRSRAGFFKSLLVQLPRLVSAIEKEQQWLQNAVKEHHFDAIISDNRFGLYHPSAPTVFITHQLMIKSPFGSWSEYILQRLNYRFINRFTHCWIPDIEAKGLAGELSHPEKKPKTPCHYLGLLSRLKKTNVAEKKGHLFISLSGPEPQRTILENKLIDEISHYDGTATIARGLPAHESVVPSTNDIRFYNHLSTEEYNKEMEDAEYVISRSGYSTLMDIAMLGKKSILIPTPGQTEQEYLATYMEQLKYACWSSQKDFSLQKMLKKAASFPYRFPAIENNNALSAVVSDFIDSVTVSDRK